MSSIRQVLARGAVDVIPVLPGIVPFGMIAGASAVAAGLEPVVAQGLSVILFAGASQLAAAELLSMGAAWPVILLTILVINLRFVMYSAALSPHLARLSLPAKCGLAYLITDQGFAVTVARQHRQPQAPHVAWYYLGASLALWLTWQLGTLAGILVGSLVPASWQLEFAAPLVFLALLVPLLTDRGSVAASLVAGILVLAGRNLPGNLGLVLAALGGVAGGLVAEHWRDRVCRKGAPS